ncbi:MAG: DUF1820 family protein [Xanthomonadales bacterium]|nr:DUF1820 family protein [Xanthomonadales bacterium]
MPAKSLYRATFLKHGKVYEMFCSAVDSSSMWGFVELSGLLFDTRDAVVVDPVEERMRDEFEDVESLFLPMHSVLSIERVSKRGKAVIRDRESGEKVTPFPLSPQGQKRS